MLTARENMIAAITGGKPDRFVNNFEALSMRIHPAMMHEPKQVKGGPDIVNSWGVTRSFPVNVPAAFPVHTPDKVVCKDIEHWQDYVHAPSTDFSSEEWAMCKETMYDTIDATKTMPCTLVVAGLFEQTHHLCGMQEALMYYMINPDEMKDLIKYLTEYELRIAEGICSHLKPESIFHHDDWGSETNSFLPPAMFEDFFLDAYKQIYGYYHDHGVKYIFHHSDSYCANILDSMIEMGIDVWQGCMHSNNVPELVKKYKGKLAFMGDIDNKFVDFEGWTPEDCYKAGVRACEENGMENFIPCITQGGSGSTFPGSYAALVAGIDRYNSEKFGFSQAELEAARGPLEIMFG